MFEFKPLKTPQKGVETNIYYSAFINGVEVGYVLLQNYNFKVGNAELAYKIYEPFRNHHIATDMVKEFMDFAKEHFYITYFDAYVRDTNHASKKVLLNNCFECKPPKKIPVMEETDRVYFFYDIVQKEKEHPSKEDIDKVLKGRE